MTALEDKQPLRDSDSRVAGGAGEGGSEAGRGACQLPTGWAAFLELPTAVCTDGCVHSGKGCQLPCCAGGTALVSSGFLKGSVWEKERVCRRVCAHVHTHRCMCEHVCKCMLLKTEWHVYV